jgi:two-component system response regulator NreC
MAEERTRILLIDEHAILRHGLRRILSDEPDMIVVGDVSTGSDALKRSRQTRPDVVITDIAMPERDGIESLRQIQKTTSARILVLTAQIEHHIISAAVSAGVSGYLEKNCVDTELVAAVRTILQGGTVFSPNVSRLLADRVQHQSTLAARSLSLLTPREREVFLLLAEGKTASEAAGALFVSPKTVHTHRHHILEKLGLRTTTELIRLALRERLV